MCKQFKVVHISTPFLPTLQQFFTVEKFLSHFTLEPSSLASLYLAQSFSTMNCIMQDSFELIICPLPVCQYSLIISEENPVLSITKHFYLNRFLIVQNLVLMCDVYPNLKTCLTKVSGTNITSKTLKLRGRRHSLYCTCWIVFRRIWLSISVCLDMSINMKRYEVNVRETALHRR